MKQVKKTIPEDDINLIPIMNLFVALIPFLLMSASFLHISIINASVPTIADESTEIEIEKQKVNMTIQIQSKGFKLSGGNEFLSNEDINALQAKFGRRHGKYPFEKLNQKLAAIKSKYPKSDTVVIIPDKGVKYQTLVSTMDAARKFKDKLKEGSTLKDDLFPNVVVSSVVE